MNNYHLYLKNNINPILTIELRQREKGKKIFNKDILSY